MIMKKDLVKAIYCEFEQIVPHKVKICHIKNQTDLSVRLASLNLSYLIFEETRIFSKRQLLMVRYVCGDWMEVFSNF